MDALHRENMKGSDSLGYARLDDCPTSTRGGDPSEITKLHDLPEATKSAKSTFLRWSMASDEEVLRRVREKNARRGRTRPRREPALNANPTDTNATNLTTMTNAATLSALLLAHRPAPHRELSTGGTAQPCTTTQFIACRRYQ